MKKPANKGLLIATICLLAVLLAALLGVMIYLNNPWINPEAHLSQTTPAPTTAPVTTAEPETTPQPETTPEPETTPAPTTLPPVPFTLSADPAQPLVYWDENMTLSGTADPSKGLFINDSPVPVEADGSFSCVVPLAMGSQSVTVSCGEDTATYQVERRYAMQSFTPSVKTAYHANQTMSIRVIVRQGSTLSVSFRGEAVEMRKTVDQLGSGAMEGFVLYVGGVGMPTPQEEKNLGKITYTVTCDGITETYESSDVICAATVQNVLSDPSATPEGYWNVGSGYIVEITDVSVETLNGKGSHDRSDPTNNYLPRGTVDYGSEGLIVNEGNADLSYRLLRCGVRVYNTSKNVPNHKYSRVVDCYYGTLPDHNEINIASLTQEGHHTYLTLDCLWKAPFYFDFEEQQYRDVSRREYIVEKFDPRYIDITFCYANQVTGELTIPADHPLFQKAEILQNTSDMTLRLWLKKEGGLYGWDAYYNENDQLVFQFLNPVTVTRADNAYGADLTGVTVMLDVGHGGEDIGAAGKDSRNVGWTEKERNLLLAEAVKKELESIGATVVMNRTTGEEVVTQRERIQFLKEVSPDYCLAIHHNSALDRERNGFETGFFTIFSQSATEHILKATREADIYKGNRLIWFYYYVCRQTVCPIVLTENGYMSNVEDLEQAIRTADIQKKAQALTQGIANYYLELSGLYAAAE